jgi:hypothetical protein
MNLLEKEKNERKERNLILKRKKIKGEKLNMIIL